MPDNTTIVLDYMARIARGDLDGAFALADDAAIFRGPDGSLLDKVGLRAMFAGLSGILVAPLEQEIIGTTSEGERVAVEATARTRLGNGHVYSNRYHFLFRVEEGAIVEVREYCDTRAADVFTAVPLRADR